MMNINLITIKNYILDTVKNILPSYRKKRYSNEYMLDKIILATKEFISWESFGRVINTFYNNIKHFHYKYISEVYRKWCKYDIFKIAYTNYLKNTFHNNSDNIELNVDVTCISNLNGIENIGLNPEYTKKNVTKICFLNTSDNKPISIVPVEIKTKCYSYNTLQHDSKCLQKCVDNILVDIKSKNIIIQCDKGFQSSTKYLYKNSNVVTIIPPKKKSLKQLSKELNNALEKIKYHTLKLRTISTSKRYIKCEQKMNTYVEKRESLLKLKDEYINENKTITNKKSKRYMIENYFSKIKRIPKLIIRNEKTIGIFISTIYLSVMLSL